MRRDTGIPRARTMRVMLGVIRKHSGEELPAWQIMQEGDISRMAAYRCIKYLEAHGVIVVKRVGGECNRYWLGENYNGSLG